MTISFSDRLRTGPTYCAACLRDRGVTRTAVDPSYSTTQPEVQDSADASTPARASDCARACVECDCAAFRGESEAGFCTDCGHPRDSHSRGIDECVRCGATLQDGTRFCGACGEPAPPLIAKIALPLAVTPAVLEQALAGERAASHDFVAMSRRLLAERWAWIERQNNWVRAGLIAGGLLFILIIAVIVSGPDKHYGPKDAVDGHLSKNCDAFTCTSPDAARALRVSNVWCRWRGSNVIVHARLKNGMAADVNLSITPKYRIKDGGQHGTSLGSDIPISLAAGQAIDWIGDAGHPEGVPDGTSISECVPHLHDIDVG